VSREELNRLKSKLEERIEQLKKDGKELDETSGFENIAVENFDYVPIVQEVIKGDEDADK